MTCHNPAAHPSRGDGLRPCAAKFHRKSPSRHHRVREEGSLPGGGCPTPRFTAAWLRDASPKCRSSPPAARRTKSHEASSQRRASLGRRSSPPSTSCADGKSEAVTRASRAGRSSPRMGKSLTEPCQRLNPSRLKRRPERSLCGRPHQRGATVVGLSSTALAMGTPLSGEYLCLSHFLFFG